MANPIDIPKVKQEIIKGFTEFTQVKQEDAEKFADEIIKRSIDAATKKVVCHVCKTELSPVFTGKETVPSEYQFDNALWIEFRGGYGMFIDTMDDWTIGGSPPKVVLCHDCAHGLCDSVVWIGDLLDPPKSHSHGAKYREANSGHYGWDYEYVKDTNTEKSQ